VKQIVQNYGTGELSLEEVPVPQCRPGGVLVRTAYSLVSAGTERMKVEQARMNLLAKARARPDKVRQVVQSVKQVGVLETYNKVRERLNALTPLGYSMAGTVVEVGEGVDEFSVGDYVACGGEKRACHAEFVYVPRNLCVPVPPTVDLKDAAFTTVGAIALQGVRQAGVALGDSVLVIGLGLVGLIAVQILKAAGCRVVGVDLDPRKVEWARQSGADLAFHRDDPALEDGVRSLTAGAGADAAYIAASTHSEDPMMLAGRLLRDRGRVVIVGRVRVEADWQTYYYKELSVVMSRSYGPGRYDRTYEDKGVDYPIGHVRWTERRNMEEFVRLLETGQVCLTRHAPRIFKLAQAPEVYQQLQDDPGWQATGVLFEYPQDAPLERRVLLPRHVSVGEALPGKVGIGVIGAGHFATATLIPALKRVDGVRMRSVASAGGLTARSAATRHQFEICASSADEVTGDKQVQAVVIATRHDSHADLAARALRAGKHVFVEKPLALSREQLQDVMEAQADTGRILMPGFNRRFSPLAVAVRDFFSGRSGPIEVVCRVNAGEMQSDSWYADVELSGWRIISEGCHFVDLIQFICGSPPVRVYAEMIAGHVPGGQNDNCCATLKMEDGSVATLMYVANGDPYFEKERVEVFGQGRAAVIENWAMARLMARGRTRKVRPGGTGKGHQAQMQAFVTAVREGLPSPIPPEEASAATLATFAIVDALHSGEPQTVEPLHGPA